MDLALEILTYIIAIAVIIGLTFLALKINKAVFKKLHRKNKNIHHVFSEKLIKAIIIIVAVVLIISTFAGAKNLWKTLLGGTAVISAVIGFAAQDVIKDILAGYMISIYKPFDIGNRIELEDGTMGIVEDITMRHVVLRGVDTNRIIIPNSKLNSMLLQNHSYKTENRSCYFEYSVGYNTDVNKAKETVFEAVKSSEYSVPALKRKKDDEGRYGQVYFRRYTDSALVLGVTVYYEKNIPTEVLIDDINGRVNKALISAGIEIPYNYVNVVEK